MKRLTLKQINTILVITYAIGILLFFAWVARFMGAKNRWLEENKNAIQEYDVQVVECYKERQRDLYYQIIVEFSDGHQMHVESSYAKEGTVKFYSITYEGNTYYGFTRQLLFSEIHPYSESLFLVVSAILMIAPFALYSYLRVTYGYGAIFTGKRNKFI